MTTESVKLGPGRLRLKYADDATKTYEQQFNSFTVEVTENVETEEAIPTLDGGEIAAEDTVTHSATIAGNIVQDISAAGLVNFTWDLPEGALCQFWFVPNNEAGRAFHGLTRPIPLKFGGELKKRNLSDFTWVAGNPDSQDGDGNPVIKGKPVLGDYDAVDNVVTEDV